MLIAAYAVFLCFPILGGMFSILGFCFDPSKWRIYLPPYILTIFMLSYSYVPPYEMDLTRYFEMVQFYGQFTSIEQFLSYRDDGLIVQTLIFGLIGKTGKIHLLPAISNSIVYGVAGYLTCDTAQELNLKKYIPLMLLFQLVMLPFLSITSNVRNVCSFSLIILAVYIDIIKNKKTIGLLILYIIPCFFHTSAIILVLMRFSLFITQKYRMPIMIAVLSMPLIINTLYRNLSNFLFLGNIGNIIRTIIIKAYNYLDTTEISDYERRLLSSSYEKVQRLFMISFAILIALIIFFNTKQLDKKRSNFNSFVFLICFMTVGCNIFIAPHYWRFYSALVVSCSLILLPLFTENYKLTKLTQIFLYALPIYAVGGITMNIYKLSSSIEIEEWASGFLLENPYTIIFDIFFKN